MEKLLARRPIRAGLASIESPVSTGDWRDGLPVLTGDQVMLREMELTDAAALATIVSADEVSRFISAPPDSGEAFERFIADARRQRNAGCGGCYAVLLKGFETPIGLVQLRMVDRQFGIAEWGFAITSDFWGTGIFQEVAALFLAFVFGALKIHRLEARAAVRNGRGNAVLRKLGAVQEGVLRKSFYRHGEYHDQVMYAMVADDWRAAQRERSAHAISASIH
jgi:ribosomal-protein-alanine N-acetyltransferase